MSRALNDAGHSIVGVVVPIESRRYQARQRLRDIGIELISHTTHGIE
jgi:hypothetical protein